jgi:uncharacterized membrane protein YccC
MPIAARSTWSRKQLDVRQRIAGEKRSGLFTPEKQSMLLLAVKTTAAAGICYWLAKLIGLQEGYWGSISSIIVMQSNVGSTVTASRDRLVGTLIGAAVAAGFLLVSQSIWAYLLAVVTAMVICSLLGLKNSSRLAGVTVTILMLVHKTGSNWTLASARVIEVLLGIVVALLMSTLVLPSRARHRLRDSLAQQYLLMGALLGVIMEGFRGQKSESFDHLSKDVQASLSTNEQLFEAARNEPSTDRSSMEGLTLLHQFSQELEDALKALALAVHGSSNDAYAARLEPELGKLSTDVQLGFQYVARCIHNWQFGEAPSGFELERDIAALESRVAQIRPIVHEFPQDEILRAYAVQLHLKQIARLLRSSRIQTSQTTGSARF